MSFVPKYPLIAHSLQDNIKRTASTNCSSDTLLPRHKDSIMAEATMLEFARELQNCNAELLVTITGPKVCCKYVVRLLLPDFG